MPRLTPWPDWVFPDRCGISRWLEVAALARVAGKRVVPAGWSMMQIDQHLAAVTPHCWMVEWIPWLLEIFQNPVNFILSIASLLFYLVFGYKMVRNYRKYRNKDSDL